MRERTGPAVIVQHCAVFGQLETPVRWFKVGKVGPYAQYKQTVTVCFRSVRERNSASYTMKPDNLRYLTVEADGRVLYDSRADVPCDMAHWEKTRAEFERRFSAIE
jgi:hypothetical protein